MQLPIAELTIGAIMLATLIGLYYALRLPRVEHYQVAPRQPQRRPLWTILLILVVPILWAVLLWGAVQPSTAQAMLGSLGIHLSGDSTTLKPAANPAGFIPDVNGDGVTNIVDLQRVAACLGQAPSGPGCTAADVNGDGVINTTDLTLVQNRWRTRLTTVARASPMNGETDVSVARETILEFSRPLNPTGLMTSTVTAQFGGQVLGSNVHVSRDGKTFIVNYLQPLPASSRVRVTVDVTNLSDAEGYALDANGDGLAGGLATIDFDTLSLTRIAGTNVFGYVYDSYEPTKPLARVTIRVDGFPEANATTDSNGYFILRDMPAPMFFVHIDGSTATNAPPGSVYATVGKPFHSVAGRTTQLTMDGATFNIYLPPMSQGDVQNLSPSTDTNIVFGSAGKAQLVKMFPNLDPSMWDLTKVAFPPNAAIDKSGTPATQAAIIPVPADKLPAPLPPGLNHQLDIAVMAGSATNFDVPAPACFPNLPDPDTKQPLKPGEKAGLYSFNHKTGMWEVVGSMTVGADGKMICSDAGVGIRAPGWHGTGPAPVGPPPPPPPPCGGNPGDYNKCLRRNNEDTIRCIGYCSAAAVAGIAACALAGPGFPICAGGVIAAQAICEAACIHTGIVNDNRCREDFCQQSPRSPIARQGGTTLATGDPVVDQITQKVNQIRTLVYPYAMSAQELPQDIQNQVTDLLAQANAVAGGDAAQYTRNFLLQREQAAAPLEAEVGEAAGNAPSYSVLYMAEIQRPNDILRLRGKTGPFGQYQLFIPRDGVLRYVSFYDPRTKSYGVVYPKVRPDATYRLPRFTLQPLDATFPDFDNDGLPDVVEFVYGTNPANPDTDGDGIPDGAEVDQGTDPLDGLIASTGIVASAKTPGTAVDVAAFNNIVVTAELDQGVSVLDVTQGLNPTVIAQVSTPGSAQSVAFTGNLVAVADGTAGLLIVDITDPPAARITNQISVGGPARSVSTAGRIAYVGTDTGQIVVVDMLSGTLLDQVTVGGEVHDLAIEGDVLYALLANELRAYAIPSGVLQFRGSVATSGYNPDPLTGRKRLFVGGGIAYATSFPGYDTFDVRNPAAMQRIGSATTGGPFSFKQLVANGSGLGVAAVGVAPNDQTHDLWLYDVSNPAVTNQFLTTLNTPGIARAVSIFNGLAYVADGDSGLQVINYREYDRFGKPPTITLSTNIAPGFAEEGKTMRVSAIVSDDVQVRNVEFYVDGVKQATDGNFPFEYRFTTPLRSQQPSFALRAKATDTGGNSTFTPIMTLTLVADATPPQVVKTSPALGSIKAVGSLTSVSVSFSEPISQTRLSSATFQLFKDNVLYSGGTISYRDEINTAFMTFGVPLAAGSYRAVVSGSMTDLVGNALGADYVWTFGVRQPVQWIRDADGFWDDGSNWSTGAPPIDGDFVIIDRPAGNFTITYRTGNLAISQLQSNEAIVLNAGTLTLISGTSTINNVFTLSGGTLSGAGDLIVNGAFNWTGGVMSGSGSTFSGGGMNISGGGFVYLSQRTLNNAGTATWTGTGSINGYNGAVFNNLAGATFDAQNDASFTYCCGGAGPTFNNAGTFRKSAGSGTTTFNSSVAFNNSGTVNVQTGMLNLAGGGTSSGTFNVAAGGTLNFGGGTHNLSISSSVSGAGTVGFSGGTGGTTNLVGTYTVSGSTVVNGGTAAFNTSANTTAALLSSGTLAGSGVLTVTNVFSWTGGTMSGAGATNVAASSTLNISGGANKFLDTRTLNNAGTATWTGDIYGYNGAVFNNLAGATFDAQNDASFTYCCGGAGPTFNNAGTFRKSAGSGTTTFGSSVAFSNTGTVDVQTGTLNLTNGATLNSGTKFTGAGLTRVTGGTVTLNGSITSQNFEFASGTLTGTGSISGTFTWTGGTLSGAGATTIAAGSTLNISGRSDKFLDRYTLNNAGTTTWTGTGSIIGYNGAVFNNLAGATFDAQNDASFNWYGSVAGPTTFNNAGTFRKSAGSGTTTFGGNVAFNNTGTVDVQSGTLSFASYAQSAGTTSLSGGNLGGTININGGALSGAGTITGTLFNGGQVNPGGASTAGMLSIVGNYSQAAGGTLNIELGGTGAGTFDKLTVSGSATLNGTLNVSTIGGFTPASGNSFQVMTYGSRSGSFATVVSGYIANYNANDLTLVAQ